ncbi:MAG: GNAT family N-acetyltransferase [Bdellovibrionales bacterium]
MSLGQLKKLQVADAGAVFSLLKMVYEKPAYPLGGGWSLRLVETELEKGLGYGWCEAGKLHALVLLRDQGQVWDIVVLATNPGRQRQGDMTRLLKSVADLRPQGVELWLEVHEANLAAQNLYKKLGFRQVGERRKYYQDGGAAVLYTLR